MRLLEDIIFYKILSLLCHDIFFSRHMAAFFETNVLKEVHIFRYLHDNSALLLLKFQNKAILYYTYI